MKWFMLIYRMATSKTGVSINEMKRELEIKDYKTVWTMAHKVRKAMADRDARYTLAGLVEVDESLFGPSSPGKRGRGAEKKELVIVAVSAWTDKAGKERPGFAHAFVAENAKADTIESILKRLGISENEVAPLIKSIRSDGWRSYQTVSNDLDMIHQRAVLRDPKDSMKLLPWTHRVIANAKAVFAGPPGEYPKNIFNVIFPRSVIASTVDSGSARHFIAYCTLAPQQQPLPVMSS
jgi:hypothetical protein